MPCLTSLASYCPQLTGKLDLIVFEPRSHFISWNVVLNTTVVDSDWCFYNLCDSHFQVKVSGITSVDGINMISQLSQLSQLSRNRIGRLSVKP